MHSGSRTDPGSASQRVAVLFAERTATVPALPYGLLASVFCTFLAVAVAAPIGTARQQVSHTEAGPYVNAAGSQPLGQLLVEPPQGRRACAGDGLRQQLKGLLPPHHRARAAAGAPRDALRHAALRHAAAAPFPSGHHRELGGLRGRGQHRAGSLLRAGADRGCSFKALPADLWPGVCQAAGPKCPGAARATAPGAGRDVST